MDTENKLNIVVIESTTRKLRESIKAAKFVEQVGREFSDQIEIIFVDVMDFFPLPGEGHDPESIDQRWQEINKQSDGYFIVAPEYNHSFPGSLKMLLDNDLGNYNHKPVVIAGVSSGPFGGARMIENLVNTLRFLGFTLTNVDTFFPSVKALFDGSDASNLLLETQKQRVRKAYEELIWLAKILKSGRNSLNS